MKKHGPYGWIAWVLLAVMGCAGPRPITPEETPPRETEAVSTDEPVQTATPTRAGLLERLESGELDAALLVDAPAWGMLAQGQGTVLLRQVLEGAGPDEEVPKLVRELAQGILFEEGAADNGVILASLYPIEACVGLQSAVMALRSGQWMPQQGVSGVHLGVRVGIEAQDPERLLAWLDAGLGAGLAPVQSSLSGQVYVKGSWLLWLRSESQLVLLDGVDLRAPGLDKLAPEDRGARMLSLAKPVWKGLEVGYPDLEMPQPASLFHLGFRRASAADFLLTFAAQALADLPNVDRLVQIKLVAALLEGAPLHPVEEVTLWAEMPGPAHVRLKAHSRFATPAPQLASALSTLRFRPGGSWDLSLSLNGHLTGQLAPEALELALDPSIAAHLDVLSNSPAWGVAVVSMPWTLPGMILGSATWLQQLYQSSGLNIIERLQLFLPRVRDGSEPWSKSVLAFAGANASDVEGWVGCVASTFGPNCAQLAMPTSGQLERIMRDQTQVYYTARDADSGERIGAVSGLPGQIEAVLGGPLEPSSELLALCSRWSGLENLAGGPSEGPFELLDMALELEPEGLSWHLDLVLRSPNRRSELTCPLR